MESITKTKAPSVQITAKEIRVTSPEQLIPVLVRKLRIPLTGTTRQMLNYLQNDALMHTDNDQEIMFMMTVVVIKSLENGAVCPCCGEVFPSGTALDAHREKAVH